MIAQVRLIGPVALLLLLAVGFDRPALAAELTEAEQVAKTTAELKEAGAHYGAAYNAHDVEGVLAFIDEQSIVVDWRGEAHQGRAAIRGFFEASFRNNPDLKMSSALEARGLSRRTR